MSLPLIKLIETNGSRSYLSYTLHNQILERVEKATYLGVEVSGDLTWADHINKTSDKANKQLAFLRRNLRINTTHVKETAYKGLVRPIPRSLQGL